MRRMALLLVMTLSSARAQEAPKEVREEKPVAPAAPRSSAVVPGKRRLPIEAKRHAPRPVANNLDGKVWTSTLYTVTSPLQVEWGYGQVGAQIDADTLGGLPVGLHFDGFAQQRLYHRPLRLGTPYIFGRESYQGRGGVMHPRYFTYDRVTEANIAVRHPRFSFAVGRSIVPFTYMAAVDGLYADVAVLEWGRIGGFAGLMPELWHPRMWLDRDYRSLSGFFASGDDPATEEREGPVTFDPLANDVKALGRDPLRLLAHALDGQTLFNLRSGTAGGYFTLRFSRFTSDSSVQAIFWNPTSTYSYGRQELAVPVGEYARPVTALRLVDAIYVNNSMTFRPLNPLSFHLRASWDAWGALRSFNLTPLTGGGAGDPDVVRETAMNILDHSFGIREVYGDVSFRGDWPFGLSLQAHHYQSLVTAQSYAFYQHDLVRPDPGDEIAHLTPNTQSRFLNILSSKKFNTTELGVVQRERLKLVGWVSPMGFLFPSSSMQLYAEGFLEWRRDFPKLRPLGEAMCTLDKDGDGRPEQYQTREECYVCIKEEVLPNGRTRAVQKFTKEECGDDGYNHVPRQDDYLRAGATVGLRDPTLYDNVDYDLSVTAIDGWSNKVVVARARVGVQAFDALLLDTGFSYEFSQNQRYYTSPVKFDTAASKTTSPPYYPRAANSHAFIFDANVLYRVALGVTFEASYLIMVEEQPLIQDYIIGDGSIIGSPPQTVGYIPRDPYQAQQLLLLRAAYRL